MEKWEKMRKMERLKRQENTGVTRRVTRGKTSGEGMELESKWKIMEIE